MGANICGVVQIKRNGSWQAMSPPFSSGESYPFDYRDYNVYGFLASVRNDKLRPLSNIKGLPNDHGLDLESCMFDDSHSHTYFLFSELANFEYGSSVAMSDGTYLNISYNELFHTSYFEDLEVLSQLGKNVNDIRLILWFDN